MLYFAVAAKFPGSYGQFIQYTQACFTSTSVMVLQLLVISYSEWEKC